MSLLRDEIGDTRLGDLFLPGSHDAATEGCSVDSYLVDQNFLFELGGLVTPEVRHYLIELYFSIKAFINYVFPFIMIWFKYVFNKSYQIIRSVLKLIIIKINDILCN